MGKNTLIWRRLVWERLNLTDRQKVEDEEKKTHYMMDGGEIIRKFFGKLKYLKFHPMPDNTDDLWFGKFIPCAPKVRVETAQGPKNIGGSQILDWFSEYDIFHILKEWNEQMDMAKISVWDCAVFSDKKGKVSGSVYDGSNE